MKKIILLLVLACFIVLSACTTLNRYSSARLSGNDSSLVSIDLFGYTLYSDDNEVPRRTLWDLNATAQANLLDILNQRYPDNEWFISSLSNNYLSIGDNDLLADYTSRDLRLILSVSKKRDYSNIGKGPKAGTPAADRIEYLKFSITLPDSVNIQFDGWNRYSTEYAEIDIAGVSFNRSFDLGSESDINNSAEYLRKSGSISVGSNLSLKEEQKIKYRYLKLNGKINDRQIEIEEEGTREIDLTGNIIADVSVSFGSFRERVFIPNIVKIPGKGSTMNLEGSDIFVPDIECKPGSIVADLEIEFIFRHVTRGSKTFQEWDDHVEYYAGKKTKKIILMQQEDYLPPIHVIANREFPEDRLMIKSDSEKWYTLKFRNYNEAIIFMDWLKHYSETSKDPDQAIMAGRNKLYYKSQELTKRIINNNIDFGVVAYY